LLNRAKRLAFTETHTIVLINKEEKIMKINIKALALSIGIVWGLAVFLLTVWFLITCSSGILLSKLGTIYCGYSVSWLGAFIGFVYGFINGLIGGALVGFLYNKFAK
jgi:hypothetical protein